MTVFKSMLVSVGLWFFHGSGHFNEACGEIKVDLKIHDEFLLSV